VPKELRGAYQAYRCRQSVASVEEILKQAAAGNPQVSTGDLAVTLGAKVYQGQNCFQAWAEMSRGYLVELLNAVRNRILDLAIALWKEAPGAGESDPGSNGIESTRVSQIFNTTVYGGAANIVGTAANSSVAFSVKQNDIGSLAEILIGAGIPESDLETLRRALYGDKPPQKGGGFGQRKAADGTWKVALAVAADVLAKAIS
jgi:hypothetical protein